MLVMALMNLCVLSCSVMSDSLQKSSVSVSKHRGQKSVAGRSHLSPRFLPLLTICSLYDPFPLNVGGIQEYKESLHL